MSKTIPDEPEETTLNDQIADSISAMHDFFKNNAERDVGLIAYQIMAQSAGLAMLNAVNQQQQMYILQNAVTTAAAKAALESNPEEAVKIINDAMKQSDILETFNGLKNFMDDLTNTYNDVIKKSPAKEKTSSKETNTKTKKEGGKK